MKDRYEKILQDNLHRFFRELTDARISNLKGTRSDGGVAFRAFGRVCKISPQGITIGGQKASSVVGILISLYGLHADSEDCIIEPMKAFKDFPNSMPYVGAFATHAEGLLIPHIERIRQSREKIVDAFNGMDAPSDFGGDCSFIVFPLPKTALCYIFYEADEDFPPSAKCLFSNNAHRFLPIDGLADLGEYTSKALIDMVQ